MICEGRWQSRCSKRRGDFRRHGNLAFVGFELIPRDAYLPSFDTGVGEMEEPDVTLVQHLKKGVTCRGLYLSERQSAGFIRPRNADHNGILRRIGNHQLL